MKYKIKYFTFIFKSKDIQYLEKRQKKDTDLIYMSEGGVKEVNHVFSYHIETMLLAGRPSIFFSVIVEQLAQVRNRVLEILAAITCTHCPQGLAKMSTKAGVIQKFYDEWFV